MRLVRLFVVFMAAAACAGCAAMLAAEPPVGAAPPPADLDSLMYGRRAVVAVIDENYNVIFEEQVERFWELRDTPIEVRAGTAAAFEYIVFGPRCDKSLILRRKDAA